MRYGYRRIHVLLKREGWNVNPKRISATRTNEIWVMDFVHGQLATGRKLRVLTIFDTFGRFSPALDVASNSALPTSSRC